MRPLTHLVKRPDLGSCWHLNPVNNCCPDNDKGADGSRSHSDHPEDLFEHSRSRNPIGKTMDCGRLKVLAGMAGDDFAPANYGLDLDLSETS